MAQRRPQLPSISVNSPHHRHARAAAANAPHRPKMYPPPLAGHPCGQHYMRYAPQHHGMHGRAADASLSAAATQQASGKAGDAATSAHQRRKTVCKFTREWTAEEEHASINQRRVAGQQQGAWPGRRGCVRMCVWERGGFARNCTGSREACGARPLHGAGPRLACVDCCVCGRDQGDPKQGGMWGAG